MILQTDLYGETYIHIYMYIYIYIYILYIYIYIYIYIYMYVYISVACYSSECFIRQIVLTITWVLTNFQ